MPWIDAIFDTWFNMSTEAFVQVDVSILRQSASMVAVFQSRFVSA